MTGSWLVDRSPRGLVVVSGPDASSFLQSLVSQDLDPIADGQSAHSLLLTPQGKLGVDFRIAHVDEEWWLDTDAEYGPRLAASLTRFRIRVKAEIDDRTASTGLLTVVGEAEAAPSDGVRAMITSWGGVQGVDLLGSIDSVRAALAELVRRGVEERDAEEFEAFRIESGVPRLGVDMDEKTIPQEALLERDAVSFTKGCFLGQELVTRIDTRGHVNRYLRRVRVDGSTVPPTGSTVVADGRDVGTVTSAAPLEGRVTALAMVRREVEPPAPVVVRWDGGEAPAVVEAVP